MAISSFPLKNRIALTTGDSKGVGFVISQQALKKIGPQKNFQFIVWSDKNSPNLKVPSFKTLTFKSSTPAFESSFNEKNLIQIKSSKNPGTRLIQAGKRALKEGVSALITGPVSKTNLKKYKSVGQTDLLKKLSDCKEAFMCFRGLFFNVILLSDHIPLKKISLQTEQIKHLLKLALSSRTYLSPKLQKKPLALLGLNPHAGEKGILGSEEEKILKPILKSYKEVVGPLSPDSAFLKKNWRRYSFFISLYHDQGLIPFKIIHEQKAFAQSLGLPFLRLGVSHGTGYDLKKKNISSDSFFLAIKEALRWIRKNRRL